MSTILIVDDSQTLRQVLSELLQANGMTVIEAVNGVNAKELLQSKSVDLVITDLIMPEMNGYDLCRWIRQEPSVQNLPILICSTKGEEFDRYWGMKQGANAYIAKPFHPSELVQAVKLLLRNAG